MTHEKLAARLYEIASRPYATRPRDVMAALNIEGRQLANPLAATVDALGQHVVYTTSGPIVSALPLEKGIGVYSAPQLDPAPVPTILPFAEAE